MLSQIKNPNEWINKLVHVEGWHKGAVFYLRGTDGKNHKIMTPKTHKIMTTSNNLLTTYTNGKNGTTKTN